MAHVTAYTNVIFAQRVQLNKFISSRRLRMLCCVEAGAIDCTFAYLSSVYSYMSIYCV